MPIRLAATTLALLSGMATATMCPSNISNCGCIPLEGTSCLDMMGQCSTFRPFCSNHTATDPRPFCCCCPYDPVPETSVRLMNGAIMPKLAFGAQVWPADTCYNATTAALDAGFRFVWSSALIGPDCQAAQKKAIDASSIDRSDLFLAGTANTGDCADKESCFNQTKAAVADQLALFGTLDMLMLDYPSSSGCEGILGQWSAFDQSQPQSCKVSGEACIALAVSNFSPEQLHCIIDAQHTQQPAPSTPVVNQLQYAVGSGHDELVQTDAAIGQASDAKAPIIVQAYSPLGGGSVLSNPQVLEIAKAHGKSAAQVALRWIVQTGATINTQSTNPDHLKQDLEIFNFELSSPEMSLLSNITALD